MSPSETVNQLNQLNHFTGFSQRFFNWFNFRGVEPVEHLEPVGFGKCFNWFKVPGHLEPVETLPKPKNFQHMTPTGSTGSTGSLFFSTYVLGRLRREGIDFGLEHGPGGPVPFVLTKRALTEDERAVIKANREGLIALLLAEQDDDEAALRRAPSWPQDSPSWPWPAGEGMCSPWPKEDATDG